jgi:hypothetical protein
MVLMDEAAISAERTKRVIKEKKSEDKAITHSPRDVFFL